MRARRAAPHGPPYLRRVCDSAKRDLLAAAVHICFFNLPDVSFAKGNGDPDGILTRDRTFTHPPVRARLEKHMGKSLVSLTDKTYMNELEERIRQVLEESLNRRVAARVLDEMERLKKLILVGKTPLEDCPPELYKHPVFVFWRLVNKEVEKESKKRADAYLRKLKVKRKMDQALAESMEEVTEEEKKTAVVDVLKKCRMELIKRQGEDIHNGFRCTNSEFESQRYESNDVKNLKKLKTVDELYGLADKIIGTKRLQQS